MHDDIIKQFDPDFIYILLSVLKSSQTETKHGVFPPIRLYQRPWLGIKDQG